MRVKGRMKQFFQSINEPPKILMICLGCLSRLVWNVSDVIRQGKKKTIISQLSFQKKIAAFDCFHLLRLACSIICNCSTPLNIYRIPATVPNTARTNLQTHFLIWFSCELDFPARRPFEWTGLSGKPWFAPCPSSSPAFGLKITKLVI